MAGLGWREAGGGGGGGLGCRQWSGGEEGIWAKVRRWVGALVVGRETDGQGLICLESQ